MRKLRNRFSAFSVIFCVVFITGFTLIKGYWKDERRVIDADVINYYAYLPATFIFHDLGFEKPETIEKGKFWLVRSPIGKNVIKMSMGMSYIYLPFFAAGHVTAKITGAEAYGYSVPYKFFLLMGGLVYLAIGVIFLRKILLRYFSDKITAIAILAVTLGTNLAYYASPENTMTHIYNFALFNIFIWGTIRWFEKPGLWRLFLLGALAGLITLIRPSNIFVLLIFFLYNVYSVETLKERVQLVFKNFGWFLLMLLAFLLVWLPQFIYNLHFTGELLFYSYTDERFFFGNPQILDGLFSYRKGWLLYTPMMLISLAGIALLFKSRKEFSWMITVFMALNIYVIFSWWCWWYGGSFGQRSFIDYYGLLAIPLALVLAELANFRKWAYYLMMSFVFLLLAFNLFQTEKYLKSSIHFADMTKAAYWNSFWHVRPQPGFYDLLETPDYDLAKKGIYVVQPKNK